LTGQPWATFADPLRLPGPWLRRPATAIICDPPAGFPFERWATDRGLPVIRVTGGHDAMITIPDQLAEIVVELLAARCPTCSLPVANT
jgi:hypothetical protein